MTVENISNISLHIKNKEKYDENNLIISLSMTFVIILIIIFISCVEFKVIEDRIIEL